MTDENTPKHGLTGFFTPARRLYFYGIAMALSALAVALGLITDDLVIPLSVLIAAVFGQGTLAMKNISVKK